jgi:5-methylcytosine-specific restriction endonuclease McrA
MPQRPARHCPVAGHPPFLGRRCPLCERRADQRRGSAAERGYDARWRRESAAFLARPENGFCCCGCGERADTVDHKKPHRGDPVLFWDRRNWRPMYGRCHSRKTATQDGGFGRIPVPRNPSTRQG